MDTTNEVKTEAKVVIEKTSKKYKKRLLISSLIAIIGVMVLFSKPVVGFLLFVGGIGMFIYTKFQIWWQHE
ncbi:MAG: hypothetical protein Q7J45_02900 [bacterium]|nr:hypothetical protein [bacterium]